MGTSNKMLEGNLQWTGIPSSGSKNTPTVLASCYRNRDISSGIGGPLGLQRLYFYQLPSMHMIVCGVVPKRTVAGDYIVINDGPFRTLSPR